MRRTLFRAFILSSMCGALDLIAPGQTTPAQGVLQQHISSSCTIVQPVTFALHGQYASLILSGTGEEVFSPELGNDDVAGIRELPKSVLKALRKSGFHLDAHGSDATDKTQVVSLSKTDACPSVEEAARIAADNRAHRKRELQSIVYRAGTENISIPKPIQNQTPDQKGGVNDGTSSPLSTPKEDKGTSGTVYLAAVIGIDGKIRDAKVIKSLTEQMDRKAIEEVEKWNFEPGAKYGLPVPVIIQIEINFRLH